MILWKWNTEFFSLQMQYLQKEILVQTRRNIVRIVILFVLNDIMFLHKEIVEKFSIENKVQKLFQQ